MRLSSSYFKKLTSNPLNSARNQEFQRHRSASVSGLNLEPKIKKKTGSDSDSPQSPSKIDHQKQKKRYFSFDIVPDDPEILTTLDKAPSSADKRSIIKMEEIPSKIKLNHSKSHPQIEELGPSKTDDKATANPSGSCDEVEEEEIPKRQKSSSVNPNYLRKIGQNDEKESANSPTQETKRSEAGTVCSICYFNPPDAVYDCGHGGLCYQCSLDIWKKGGCCPYCRQVSFFPVFPLHPIQISWKRSAHFGNLSNRRREKELEALSNRGHDQKRHLEEKGEKKE